uniref:Lipocalin n=1 Tax=Rhipicephalus appendiculatus TaxID=34631 RepID=A0A131YDL3_RHIAP
MRVCQVAFTVFAASAAHAAYTVKSVQNTNSRQFQNNNIQFPYIQSMHNAHFQCIENKLCLVLVICQVDLVKESINGKISTVYLSVTCVETKWSIEVKCM